MLIKVSDTAWNEYNEARMDYRSYLADPYPAGSQEDTDCMFERLLELADKAEALLGPATEYDPPRLVKPECMWCGNDSQVGISEYCEVCDPPEGEVK